MCVRGAWRACAAHVLMARIQAPQSVWSECARMCSWRAYRRLHSETRVRMVHRLRVCLHFGRKCDLSARTGESTGTESGKKTPPRRGRVPIRRANRVRTTIDAVQRTRHAVPYSRRPRAPPDAGTSRGTGRRVEKHLPSRPLPGADGEDRAPCERGRALFLGTAAGPSSKDPTGRGERGAERVLPEMAFAQRLARLPALGAGGPGGP